MRQLDLVRPTRQPEGPAMLWGIPQDAEYQRRYRIIQSWCDSRPHDVRQFRTLHIAACTAGCEERWSTHRCVIGLATLDWLEGIRHGVTPGLELDTDTDTDTDTEDTLTIAPLAPTIRHASLSAALASVQVELGSTTDDTPVVLGRHGISVTSQIVQGEEGPSLLTSLTHTDDGGNIVHVESTWPLAWEAGLDSIQEQLAVARRCSLELLAGRPSGVPAPAVQAPQTAAAEPVDEPAPKPARKRSRRKSKPEDAPPPGVEQGEPTDEPAPPVPKVEPPTVQQLAQWFSEQEGKTSFDKDAIRDAFKAHNAGRVGAKAVDALMREGAAAGLWLWDPSKPEVILEPGGSIDDDDFDDGGDDIPPEPEPKARTLGHPLTASKATVLVEDNASPAAAASSAAAARDALSFEELEDDAQDLMGKLFDAGDWASIENAAKDNGIPYTEADGPKLDGAPMPWVQRFVTTLREAVERL